jgi:hypothetical protein
MSLHDETSDCLFSHIRQGRQWNYQMYTTHTQVSERKQKTNFDVKNTISENLPPYMTFEVLMLLL